MRARRAVTALACAPVLLLGLATAAQAAWTTGESVTTRLTTASFSYPGGSRPAAPVLDGSVLSWAPTLVSGGRAMTGYAVTAVDSTTGASSSVPCALTIGTTITCSGVPADLLTGYRFTEQPRYRGWAGSVSALSDQLPEAPVPTATPTADAPADPVPSLDVPVEPDTATTADPTVTPTPDMVPEASPEQATPTPDPTEGPVVPEIAPEAPNPP